MIWLNPKIYVLVYALLVSGFVASVAYVILLSLQVRFQELNARLKKLEG